MLETWPNGNLVARALGIRLRNDINPGFSFLLHRSGFQSEDRQKCFIGFGFWEEERERGKGFWGRFLEATTSALICVSLIFTDPTKSTLNETLLFSRAVGTLTEDIRIVKNWYFSKVKK